MERTTTEERPKPIPFEVPKDVASDFVRIRLQDVVECFGRNPKSYREFDEHLCICLACRQAYYFLFGEAF
jgi:hypothetical protein